jgi:hypothetical protein
MKVVQKSTVLNMGTKRNFEFTSVEFNQISEGMMMMMMMMTMMMMTTMMICSKFATASYTSRVGYGLIL